MDNVASTWLALQCGMIPGASRGVLLLGPPGAASTAARWPDGAGSAADLAGVAARALEQQRPVERTASGDPHSGARWIGVPFKTLSGLAGSVALEVATSGDWDPRPVVEALRLGTSWLDALSGREHFRERLSSILELIAISLEQGDLGATATSVATELATRLECERVSIGFVQRGSMRVEALSHSATFDGRAVLIRDIAAAMEEAADQDSTIVLPQPRGAPPRIVRAHEQLASEHGAGASCTVPVAVAGQIVGALTFERHRGQPLDPETLRLCEDAAALLGPILHLQQRVETRPFEQLRERLRSLLGELRGPGRPDLKLAAAGVVALVLLLFFARGEYRVTADATLEGRVQRAIVAGLDGYIAQANARAGDLVRKGQVLGRLDSRDLLLERRKWAARRNQLRTEQREALAGHDRTQVNIFAAQVTQAEAQLALLDAQLGRTRLVAPFDGVIVEGDLSQALGSPTTRGDVLFQVAPLDGYRVILNVDERDIADVERRQPGELVLSALPGRRLPLTVDRVTPVSSAENGSNYFRVEARLLQPPASLRPGMEGKAKLRVDRRNLFWIWTHEMVEWLRLWAWSWWP